MAQIAINFTCTYCNFKDNVVNYLVKVMNKEYCGLAQVRKN